MWLKMKETVTREQQVRYIDSSTVSDHNYSPLSVWREIWLQNILSIKHQQ